MIKYQLNVVDYKAFPEAGTGSFLEQMPSLLKEGKKPISVVQGMRKRLEVLNDSEIIRVSWWDYGFWTGDSIAVNSNGEVKFILDSEQLRNVSPSTKLSTNGCIILEDKLYDHLKGERFSAKKANKYGNELLTKREAKSNPFWKLLSRNDQKTLNDTVDYIFYYFFKDNCAKKTMGVHYNEPEEGVNTLQPFYVCRLCHDINYGIEDSGVIGSKVNVKSRIIGISATK